MQPCTVERVQSLCAEFGFQFSKSLGQNFLVSPNVIETIAGQAGLDSDTVVLEIGPGFGALTGALAERAGQVVALELDDALFPVLHKTLADADNVRLVHGDALQADYASLLAEFLQARRVAAANLPYYITTKAILRLLESRLFERVTVMIQREAAAKLLCAPGSRNWCLFSLLVHHYADVTSVCSVPRSCFYPQPKVDSTVLHFVPRKPLFDAAEARFSTIATAIFAMRRKTLANCLKSMPDVCDAMRRCGLDPARRGESLSLSEVEALACEAAGSTVS